MKKSISSYILIFLVLFQFVGAIPSGFSMIIDPSGGGMGIPLYLLEQSPFSNYLIPGLFLFIVLGLFPALAFYGLIKKPKIKWLEKLNPYKEYHWAWAFSYYIGIILVLWINSQLIFKIGFDVLHFLYSVLGICIIVFTHLPSTKKDYKIYTTR